MVVLKWVIDLKVVGVVVGGRNYFETGFSPISCLVCFEAIFPRFVLPWKAPSEGGGVRRQVFLATQLAAVRSRLLKLKAPIASSQQKEDFEGFKTPGR